MPEVPPDKLSNLTSVALGAVGASALVGVLAITFQQSGASWMGEVVILLGLILVLLLLWLVARWVASRKNRPFVQKLQQAAGVTPNALTAVAARAKLDDLRRSFEAGITKFRATGKDIYKLPWYLLVGEPGSGKTEAIRHSNLPFPPGLQDSLQGTGGTVNMNWWLTNQAVILDTAGRYLFGELQPGTAAEWSEFLRLLVKYRPQCPINGLILVIPAESLIVDTADKIESKAATIAQQLDRIQRALEVRFPVYVIVTKCDLINGFREFFETLDNPQLQHQILGWSNPKPLDEPFNPEQVEAHLSEVHKRLPERRLGLLLDPVAHEGMESRRIDEVDSLYSFPDSFKHLGPRLGRYLALVFVAGEWSPKPLFLRGIYFTSSMREGQALDAELAELLHVPIDSLRERRVWERDRAFFLRDVLLKKAFPEQGLVTRAPNTRKAEQTRKVALLSTGFIAAIIILAFSLWGSHERSSSISENQTAFWKSATQLKQSDGTLQILESPEIHPKSRLLEKVADDGGTSIGKFYEDLNTWGTQDVHVQPIFKPAAFLLQMKDQSNDINESQKNDAGKIYAANVLAPLIKATRHKIKGKTAGHWDEDSTAALKELIRFECGVRPDLPTLFAYVTADRPDKKAATPNPNEQAYVKVLSEGLQLFIPASLSANEHWSFVQPDSGPAQKGVNTLIDYSRDIGARPNTRFLDWQTALVDLRDRQKTLHEFCLSLENNYPKSVADFYRQRDNWKKHWELYDGFYSTKMSQRLSELDNGGNPLSLVGLYRKEQAAAGKEAADVLIAVRDSIPSDRRQLPLPSQIRDALQKRIEEINKSDDRSKQTEIEAQLSPFDSTLLKTVNVDAHEKRAAVVVHDLYKLANTELFDESDSPSTLPADPAFSVSPKSIAASGTAAGPENPVAFAQTDVSKLHANMAGPYHLNKSVAQQIASLPTQKWIADSIAKPHGNYRQFAIPAIPFTKHDKDDADQRYNPGAVSGALSAVFGTVHTISQEIAGDPKPLDVDQLSADLAQRRQPADAYLRNYVIYWSGLFPEIDPAGIPRDWKTFHEHLLSATDVNRNFKELGGFVKDALDQVQSFSSPVQIDVKRAAERTSAFIAASSDKLDLDAIQEKIDYWRTLNSTDVNAVRAILLEQPAAVLQRKYMVDAGVNEVEKYWSEVTLGLLRVVARQGEQPGTIQLVDSDLAKFPFNINSTVEITPENLDQLRQILGGTSLWGTAAKSKPENVGGGNLLGNPKYAAIDDELKALARGGLRSERFERLGRAYALIESLPLANGPATCRVEIPDENAVAKLLEEVRPKLPRASIKWSDFTLVIGKQPPDRKSGRSSDSPGRLGDISWPNINIAFEFYEHPQKPDGTLHEVTKTMNVWQCLYLLSHSNAVAAAENGDPRIGDPPVPSRKWYVRLEPEYGNVDRMGQRQHYAQWLLLTFKNPIPHPSTWSN